MKFPPYVKKRGNVYWFRRRVPDELVPTLGRAEFVESLKTTDLAQARTRAAFRNAEIEVLFEKASTRSRGRPRSTWCFHPARRSSSTSARQ